MVIEIKEQAAQGITYPYSGYATQLDLDSASNPYGEIYEETAKLANIPRYNTSDTYLLSPYADSNNSVDTRLAAGNSKTYSYGTLQGQQSIKIDEQDIDEQDIDEQRKGQKRFKELLRSLGTYSKRAGGFGDLVQPVIYIQRFTHTNWLEIITHTKPRSSSLEG